MSSVELSRRDLMKTTAATGAAAVGASAATGSATAIHDGDDPLEPDLAHVAMASVSPPLYAGVVVADTVHGVLNDSDSIDRLNIHQSAMQEKEAWDAHLIQMENRLEDTATVASIEARDGLARTYEHGGSESDALANLNERVRKFFSQAPEHNIIEIANKSLLSYHALQQDGAQTDPKMTIAGSMRDANANGYIVKIAHEEDAFVSGATVTRQDGSTHEIGRGVANDSESKFDEPTTVKCEVWDGDWTADGTKVGEFVPMSDEVLDGYDSGNEEFTITLDDGTELTGSLLFNIPSVGDPEETGAYSVNVYDHGELAELLAEIKSQSDTVVGNYDQTFVGELFTMMDEGTLDPNDIRGSEGMARFLSGTDDASESRFQLALAQQLGVERADLTNVASVTVEYSGFTETTVNRNDDGTRDLFPSTFADGKTYEGQLFARSNTDALNSGARYAARPIAYSGEQDGSVLGIDLVSGSKLAEFGSGTHFYNETVHSPSNDLIICCTENNGIFAYATDTGDEAWQTSMSRARTANIDSNGVVYVGNQGGTVRAINASDGSEEWSQSVSGSSIWDVRLSADEETLYVAGGSNSLQAVSAADGSESWSVSLADTSVDVAVAPDDSMVVTSDGLQTITALDPSDQSEQWSLSLSENLDSFYYHPDGSTVFAGTSDGTILSLDPSDGSENWRNVPGSTNTITETVLNPDGTELLVTIDNSRMLALDPSDGSLLREMYQYSDNPRGLTITPGYDEGFAGIVTDATMYDAPNARDVDLTNGELTVTKITDADGNDLDSSDYDEPDYDSYNSQEYADYIEKHTEMQKTLYEETNTTIGITNPIDGIFDWLKNFSLFGFPLWIIGAGLLGLVGYNRVKGD